MEIHIIGAGTVGSNIARDLADTHDLTVIDRDPDRIDTLTTELDVSGVVGDGRAATTLREIGLDRADIVVASTDSDAANIMVCNAAKRAGDPHTIARVHDAGLFETWQSLGGGLGVDTMMCVDLLAARSLVETITLPGANAVDTFEEEVAEVAQFEIGDDTPVTDRSIAEVDRYPSLTFAAVFREGEVLIPEGETVVRAGDSVVVIGSPQNMSRFAETLTPEPALDPDDTILIVGGDTLGYRIARLFEERGFTPRIVEHDAERVEWLEDRLREASVIEADATDLEGFTREYLPNTDLVIGAADDDTNYLLTQLTREMGAARTVAIVDDPSVVELFEGTGPDQVIHPRDIVTGEMLRVVYRHGTEEVTVLDHDNAEVLETVVDDDSVLTGRSLQDADHELPTEFVIGAIIRDGTLQSPRGGTIIQRGDRVITFVNADEADEIAEEI